MGKASTQIGDEPGEDANKPGKAAEDVQDEAMESANEASESSVQDSALQEVQSATGDFDALTGLVRSVEPQTALGDSMKRCKSKAGRAY